MTSTAGQAMIQEKQEGSVFVEDMEFVYKTQAPCTSEESSVDMLKMTVIGVLDAILVNIYGVPLKKS